MSDEQQPVGEQQPQIDKAAIEAQVRQQLQAQFDEEKQKILGNKDQILEEKRQLEAKLKGVDEEELQGFREYKKRLEQNEELQLIDQGKVDEVIQRRMSAREKAWSETQSEYEERLKAAQTQSEQYHAELEQLQQKNTKMQKHQFLKDLTGGDDTFKSDYFTDFFELNAGKMEIDQETGSVYALDNGKRMVDTDGNFVKFEDYYNKQKINHGLFWSGGSGSGKRAGQADGFMGNDPDKWTAEEKLAYVQEHGRAAFSKLVADAKRKK